MHFRNLDYHDIMYIQQKAHRLISSRCVKDDNYHGNEQVTFYRNFHKTRRSFNLLVVRK